MKKPVKKPNLGQRLLLNHNMGLGMRSLARKEGTHAQPQDGEGSDDGLRTHRTADDCGSVAEFPLTSNTDEGGSATHSVGSPSSTLRSLMGRIPETPSIRRLRLTHEAQVKASGDYCYGCIIGSKNWRDHR